MESINNKIPEINISKCESDGACVKRCPQSALEMKEISQTQYAQLSLIGKLRTKVHGRNKAFLTNAAECIGCGICVRVCPEKAIKLIHLKN